MPAEIPESASDALSLAADATAKAAGTALWDVGTLPDKWYEMYGSAQQIIGALSELAHTAIDKMPLAVVDREMYVDELVQDGRTPEQVIGEWIVHTNAARRLLIEAGDQWARAHSAIGRIGVRDEGEG